ncbi:MAG: T9SS type A sorting domain-containing protein [Luteibaculaceae bacterium]
MTKYLSFVIGLLTFSSLCFSQIAPVGGLQTPSNFVFIEETPTVFNYSINGFGGNFDTGTTFNIRFGRQNATTAGRDVILTGFQIAGQNFSPITFPDGEIYDRIVANRRSSTTNPDLGKQTLFFELGSVSSPNAFFRPTYTENQESINRRIVNRGTDNVFANGGTTRNNIERIDLMLTNGISSPDVAQAGFILNERGGNDPVRIAAITGLDANQNVSSLGPLIQLVNANWVNTGRSIVTTVFEKLSTDARMRPRETLGSQNIGALFLSLENLGVLPNQTIFGIVVFPNDVTTTMDLIGLTNVPTNTNETNGGIDIMGGGGFFVSENLAIVDLAVDLSFSNPNFFVGDLVTLNVTARNNGPFNDNGIVTSITIPDGFTFNALTAGFEGVVSIVGNQITWNLPGLLTDTEQLLQIQLTPIASGSYALQANITNNGNLTDFSLGNNSATLNIAPQTTVVIANPDDFSSNPVNGVTGGIGGNVALNDLINGQPAVNRIFTSAIVNTGGLTGVSLNSDGFIVVPTGTPADTYTITYEICFDGVCAQSTATVVVTASSPTIAIEPLNLTAQPLNGFVGGNTTTSVISGITLNGSPANESDVTLSLLNNGGLTGLVLNSDGSYTIPAGTRAGDYTVQFQACNLDTPPVCATSITIIRVTPPIIEAINNNLGGPLSITDPALNINILANDLLNGVESINPNLVTVSITVPDPTGTLTLSNNGIVNISPTGAFGIRTLTYQVCEILNPSNCSTANITAEILNNLRGATTNGGIFTVAGSEDPQNLLTGNFFHLAGDPANSNTVNATTSNVTITAASISAPAAILPFLEFDAASGTFEVLPNAPAGTFPITFEFCNSALPTQCQTSTKNITIAQGLRVSGAVDPACLCRNDVPWLRYTLEANFAPAPGTTPLFIDFFDATTRALVTTVTTTFRNAVRDSVLFPGAQIDGSGNGINWPGWRLDGGVWVEDLSFNFGNLRPNTFIQFRVNPESAIFEIEYPEATAECIASPLGPVALPVTWLFFNGRTIEESIQLNWATASEINNAFFEIERSNTGLDYEVIGNVNGMGTTSSTTHYNFIDRNPLPGLNYYRLRQVDFDGTFEFSNIIVLRASGSTDNLKIFPNPASQFITIDRGDTKIGELVIFDASGRRVYAQIFGDPIVKLDVNFLKPGFYTLQFDGVKTQKFIKQ